MCNGGGNSVKKFADGGSTGTKSKSAPKPKPTVAAAPNRAEAYRKSAGDRELDRLLQENLSKPLPASAYVDMPMSEYGARVANNAVPSVVRMATELGTMAMNPIDTASSLAKGIGQLGYGAGSKIARNVLGYEGDRASEAPLDAFIADTKGHDGLGQPGEFWKNLAEDPASYIGDAATLATGGAGAALKAKKLAKLADLPDFPAVPPPITAAEVLMNRAAETNLGQRTPEDIAFDAELDRLLLFPTEAETEALQQNLRNRTDLADNEVDGVFDPDSEAYAALETAYDNQVPEPNEIDPFDDPDLFTAQYLNDVFPSILERAQRGDPLTDREAFDVMTFERYGTDGVYDPTNTLDNWVRQTNAVYGAPHTDIEGAERLAFLTGADRTRGQNPVAPVEGPYFADTLGDVYEADDDNATDPWRYVSDVEEKAIKTGPLTQTGEGLASMYSPTRRAVDKLQSGIFPDPISLEKQLLRLGAKPDELESVMRRITEEDVLGGGLKKDRLTQFSDEAASEIFASNEIDDQYGSYFLSGASEPRVTRIEASVEQPDAVARAQHYMPRDPDQAVLAHIRSGMFQTPDSTSNNVYHLGEIQSDWAQFRTKLFSTQEDLNNARDKLKDYMDDLKAKSANSKSFLVMSPDMSELEDRIALTEYNGIREEFDNSYPAPYVKTTRKWHQLGLKQALIEAVNSGADYMSISTGKQAQGYTGGKLEGQQKFYDEMTPRELDDILTKFSKETGVEKPVLEYQFVYGYDGSGHEVPAIRLTDEFKEAMKKYGLPSYAAGGVVSLLNRTS